MHYLSSLQCILAAQSKNIVFLQNTLSLFCLSLCLSLFLFVSRLVKKRKLYRSPKTFSSQFFLHCLSCALVFVLCPLHLCFFYISPSSVTLPSHAHGLFCSLSGLWCFPYTNFSRFVSPWHTCAVSFYALPSLPPPPAVCYLTCEASIHLCLSVPSSHIPRLSLKSSEQ